MELQEMTVVDNLLPSGVGCFPLNLHCYWQREREYRVNVNVSGITF